jgi:hypothetical protein
MMECDQNVSTKSLKNLIPLVFNNIQCFSPTPLEQRGYMKLALKRGTCAPRSYVPLGAGPCPYLFLRGPRIPY